MDVDSLVKAVDPARGVQIEWPDMEQIITGAGTKRQSSPFRPRVERSSRPAWAWLVVLTLLASLLVLGIDVLPSSNPSSRPGSGTDTSIPKELVVWTSDSHVEVISSATGHVIRTLADDVSLYRGTPHVTVSPTGTVYFDEAESVNAVPTEQILKVPLLGGRVTDIAEGHDPAISPNGHLLAYLTYSDLSNTPEGIVVKDLLTGKTRTWEYRSTLPDINQLAWAPDSKSLSFTTTTPFAHKTSLVLSAWVLDVDSTGNSLGSARRIPLSPGIAWAGFLSQTGGIGVVQHLGSTKEGDWIEITQVDVRTGRIVKQLAHVPGLLDVDNSYDGTEGTLQLDPSRRDLSIAEVGSGHGTLYRLTVGVGPIVEVATGVVTAAWVPSSS